MEFLRPTIGQGRAIALVGVDREDFVYLKPREVSRAHRTALEFSDGLRAVVEVAGGLDFLPF